MIKFSALLVALAIGLLAVGVAASSLLLVYVAIGVCLVSAVLLAVGVVRHWAEIFGSESRVPAAGTVPGPALLRAATGSAGAVPEEVAAGGMIPGAAEAGAAAAGAGAPAGAGQPEPEPAMATAHAAGAGTVAPVPPDRSSREDRSRGEDRRPGREDRRPGRKEERRPRRKGTGGRPGQGPAGPAPAQPVHPAAASAARPAAPDDLWERVAEELESAGKRDTGDLAWPAAEFPLPPEPAAPAAAAWPGEPRGSSGTGWPDGPGRPPGFGDPAFPSRATGSSGPAVPPGTTVPSATSASPETAQRPGRADPAREQDRDGPGKASGPAESESGEPAQSTSSGLPRRRPTRPGAAPAEQGRIAPGGDLWQPAAYRRQGVPPAEMSWTISLPQADSGAALPATAEPATAACAAEPDPVDSLAGAGFLPAAPAAGTAEPIEAAMGLVRLMRPGRGG